MPFLDTSPLLPFLLQAFSNRCRRPHRVLYFTTRHHPPNRTSPPSDNMAITHDDLSRRVPHRITTTTDISGKVALLLVVLSILCGFSSFVLCLSAEASRSEATWFIRSSPDNSKVNECVYSGSGRTPLGCAIAAFLLLAVGMFTEHAYMLVSVTNPRSPDLTSWAAPADVSTISSSYKALTWQACFLFLTTWICFAIAEVLLMIGISVESGHLGKWKGLRSRCTVIRPGLFAAAGVLGLTTVFLGVGLYMTAMRMQRLHQEEEEARHGTPGVPHQHWVTPSAPWEPQPSTVSQSQPIPKASASV